MNTLITPVILCGGSGTRLWPLSRKSLPKQFVPLIGGKSLLQLTLDRVRPLNPDLMIVTAEAHRFMVADALQSSPGAVQVILEPVGRNTAAAMALAALLSAHNGQPEALLLFCPSDHHIPDAQAFSRTIRQGVPAAEGGAIVTFGIVPSAPSTAYGYIQHGARRADGAHPVERFMEKPNADQALQLLLSGEVLWNAGIFLCRASTLLQALQQHAPDILASCREALPAPLPAPTEPAASAQRSAAPQWLTPLPGAFAACRSQSIDYAVMEHHADVAVMPYTGAWSDVGSWNAVAELSPADLDGNRIEGQGLALLSHDTYMHAPHRPVVALGTQNLLIIDTP
ncbi:MAG: mannose-1-phosphate guanylyltransferase/mannose-6-phosphate isomerase, partial [Comamonadaceae bacterium]|nr:mannose-1-phosphate guanylyltransferase/mannose-6-phosphate isomerase [Comamonadaceae bacterium]